MKGPIKLDERTNTVPYEAPFIQQSLFLFNFIPLSKLALNLFSGASTTEGEENADEAASGYSVFVVYSKELFLIQAHLSCIQLVIL